MSHRVWSADVIRHILCAGTVNEQVSQMRPLALQAARGRHWFWKLQRPRLATLISVDDLFASALVGVWDAVRRHREAEPIPHGLEFARCWQHMRWAMGSTVAEAGERRRQGDAGAWRGNRSTARTFESVSEAIEAGVSDPHIEAHAREVYEGIARVLVTRQHRAFFELLYGVGLGVTEAAGVLGISRSTGDAWVAVVRARAVELFGQTVGELGLLHVAGKLSHPAASIVGGSTSQSRGEVGERERPYLARAMAIAGAA